MAASGDGLRRPLNAPAGQPPAYGTQPGTTSPVVLARFVIVFGPGSGVFEYSPAPGIGTLVESFTQATVDPYGNKTIPGQTSYNDAAGQAFNISAGGAGFYQGHLATGWAAAGGTAITLGSGFSAGPGSPFGVSIPAVQSDAGIFTEIAGSPAGAAAIARIVAKDPTQIFGLDAAETWHAITLDAGWAGLAGYAAPSYRLLPDGTLELTGLADFGAVVTANHNLNNGHPLPVPYRPQTTKQYRSSDVNTQRGAVQINSAGVITFLAAASAPARYCEIDAVLPLDL